MSIPVTCPECQTHFHVGDEFAGQAGRCPECHAVLQVPDPAAAPDHDHPDHLPDHPEPADRHPYWNRHEAEPFERRPEPVPRREERPEPPPPPRDLRKPPERQFDPAARAARWEAVSRGLRNLVVAVVVLTVDILVITAFVVMEAVNPAPGNNNGAPEWALAIGTGIAAAASAYLWGAGRVGCARVPYVPARHLAAPAAVVAALTAVAGVIGFGLFAAGLLVVQQGNLNGAGLVTLGNCALMPASVGFAIAEVMGLVAQIRMAEALRDRAFAQSSRLLLVGLTVLILLGMCAGCGLFIVAAAAQQRQQQQFQQQQQPGVGKDKDDKAGKDKDRPAAGGNGKGAPGGNNPPAGANPPPANPPPPEPEKHPEVVYAVAAVGLLLVLTYAAFSVACFQAGRRAIRREVRHLLGEPDEHGHPPDHY